MLLVADRDVRVITNDGELLAQFTLDPTKPTNPREGQADVPSSIRDVPRQRPGCLATQQRVTEGTRTPDLQGHNLAL